MAEGQTRRVSRKVWDRGLAWSSLPGVLSSAGEAPSQQLSACWGGGLAATLFGEQMVFGEEKGTVKPPGGPVYRYAEEGAMLWTKGSRFIGADMWVCLES